MNDSMNNVPIDVPRGDPQLIGMLQMFLGMAQRGEIVSAGIAVVRADGNMGNGSYVLPNTAVMGVMANSLDMLKQDVQQLLRQQMSQQAQRPVILRPMAVPGV